jgi:hypothetical protein
MCARAYQRLLSSSLHGDLHTQGSTQDCIKSNHFFSGVAVLIASCRTCMYLVSTTQACWTTRTAWLAHLAEDSHEVVAEGSRALGGLMREIRELDLGPRPQLIAVDVVQLCARAVVVKFCYANKCLQVLASVLSCSLCACCAPHKPRVTWRHTTNLTHHGGHDHTQHAELQARTLQSLWPSGWSAGTHLESDMGPRMPGS